MWDSPDEKGNDLKLSQAFGVMPAMQAGLTAHVWEIEELVGLPD